MVLLILVFMTWEEEWVVKTLVNKIQSKGNKFIKWNASNGQGYSVTSGVYLYMVKFGRFYLHEK